MVRRRRLPRRPDARERVPNPEPPEPEVEHESDSELEPESEAELEPKPRAEPEQEAEPEPETDHYPFRSKVVYYLCVILFVGAASFKWFKAITAPFFSLFPETKTAGLEPYLLLIYSTLTICALIAYEYFYHGNNIFAWSTRPSPSSHRPLELPDTPVNLPGTAT